MSDIPKNKRSKSKLEAIDMALNIRDRAENEILLSFAYSQKKLEESVKKSTAYIKDAVEREDRRRKLMKMKKDFCLWLIEDSRNAVLKFSKGISEHLIGANTIYPDYLPEWEERRLEFDRALMCCNKLQNELLHIARKLPSDKNKYMNIVLLVEREFKIIKALRQSDNKLLPKILSKTDRYGQPLYVYSSANFAIVNNNGNASYNGASNSLGVRPDFTTTNNSQDANGSNGKGKVVHSAEADK